MAESVEATGEFYILATRALSSAGITRIIKHADTFAVFDPVGDIQNLGIGEQGIYHHGTRHLSQYEFTVEGERPLLLSSDVTRDNHLLAVDLSNPDILFEPNLQLPRGALHVFRSKFLWDGRCYEKYRIRNYASYPVAFNLGLTFRSDFADIFEVRGMKRERRGTPRRPAVSEQSLELIYDGLDGIVRRTRIDFSLRPSSLQEQEAFFSLALAEDGEVEFEVIISCLVGEQEGAPPAGYVEAYTSSARLLSMARGKECSIVTSNEQFNTVMSRAVSDLRMLLTGIDGSLYPYAGIPWFCTPFGRDGIITALETLWFNPDISRGVLEYLGAHQADAVVDAQDAEPGKILHEVRFGEMANSGELPFAWYYGSADSTPLFVILAGQYLRRTGDLEFARRIWPRVERALDWMDRYGDRDGDGFIEYAKRAEHGLDNQAWKDSSDSVFHVDGTLAQPPIAICEVQAYAFAARLEASFLAEQLGNAERAQDLAAQARKLQVRFEHLFWDEEMKGYVLALDRDKKPCRVPASNMGHCLFAGLASAERARLVADALMGEAFFSGWGVRTLPAGQARYNPMSYHNGSIWPHDNALIAWGFARYGLKRQAARILDAMYHLSQYANLNRFPELVCGFDRRPNQGPTFYPVACSPQAWSAACIFSLLQSCLGLSIQVMERRIYFDRPHLPKFLNRVVIRNLEVADVVIDFAAIRYETDVSIEVLKRTGDISIVTNK